MLQIEFILGEVDPVVESFVFTSLTFQVHNCF